MERPNVELYVARLNGKFGNNWASTMKYCEMDKLLQYVIELENENADRRS
jgi:hypothetical protein